MDCDERANSEFFRSATSRRVISNISFAFYDNVLGDRNGVWLNLLLSVYVLRNDHRTYRIRRDRLSFITFVAMFLSHLQSSGSNFGIASIVLNITYFRRTGKHDDVKLTGPSLLYTFCHSSTMLSASLGLPQAFVRWGRDTGVSDGLSRGFIRGQLLCQASHRSAQGRGRDFPPFSVQSLYVVELESSLRMCILSVEKSGLYQGRNFGVGATSGPDTSRYEMYAYK